VTVPDGPAIRQALVEALERGDLVLVTGGLGPTSDDMTRDVAAELLGRKLVFDAQIMSKIAGHFARRNIVPPELVKVQAMVPEGAQVLANDFGTAPGLILEKGGKALVLLPGPPRELKPMWENQVVPWLKRRTGSRSPMAQRSWRIIGVGESRVQELLEAPLKKVGDFEFGYCSRTGEVDFRLITENAASLKKADGFIRSQLGEAVYAEGEETMEAVVVRAAAKKKRMIATAESCSGGLVADRLTNVPGSSKVFGFGWVTYSNEAKMEELGVSKAMLKKHGAVSEPVAKAMALGALRRSGADLAVALTGVAGPEPGSREKPAGLLWVALASRKSALAVKKNLPTDRETYKYSASQVALDLLRRELNKE
jgi:nicotinamide-nucleotide amidase